MTNRNLPLFIDLAFCLVLLPIMIMLLPIERWLTSNMVFVCILVGWLYIVYITNRCLTVPFMFRRKKYLVWSLVILILMIVITWLITQYQLDMPRHFRRPPGGRPRSNESSLRLHQQGVWFLFLVVTVFSLAMGLLTELFRQIMARHEVEFEKKKAELALYKAQINPHFLFNSLNTLYGMVVTQSEKAEAAFMQFIQLMKYMYSNASKDFIPVQTEIEYIRQYIEMQKYRMNEYTRIHFSYTDDKGTPDAVIAPMLLITFVENAIKYGVSSYKESDIYIAVKIENGDLLFAVRNPVMTEPAEGKKGIGISNCRKRMDLLYPNRHTLEIKQENGIYSVTLTLKLK